MQEYLSVWIFRRGKHWVAQFAKLHADLTSIFFTVGHESQQHQLESSLPCVIGSKWRQQKQRGRGVWIRRQKTRVHKIFAVVGPHQIFVGKIRHDRHGFAGAAVLCQCRTEFGASKKNERSQQFILRWFLFHVFDQSSVGRARVCAWSRILWFIPGKSGWIHGERVWRIGVFQHVRLFSEKPERAVSTGWNAVQFV